HGDDRSLRREPSHKRSGVFLSESVTTMGPVVDVKCDVKCFVRRERGSAGRTVARQRQPAYEAPGGTSRAGLLGHPAPAVRLPLGGSSSGVRSGVTRCFLTRVSAATTRSKAALIMMGT